MAMTAFWSAGDQGRKTTLQILAIAPFSDSDPFSFWWAATRQTWQRLVPELLGGRKPPCEVKRP